MAFEFIKTFVDNLEKLKEEKEKNIQNFTQNIEDEIVRTASFSPLKRGGTSITSHIMTLDQFGNIVFKIKGFFPIVFLGMFSIPLIATLYDFVLNINNITSDTIGNLIGGLIVSGLFFLPAFLLFYFLFRNYIFDFQNGYFYDTKYQKELFNHLYNEKYKNKFTPISQIHALQIISERVHGNKTSFTSYELNMICKDSSRVNIIDHANLEEIRKDAQELATRLGVKIYDLTLSYVDNY